MNGSRDAGTRSLTCCVRMGCVAPNDTFFSALVLAVFTRQHIVLAYNINQITVVFLQKPNMRRSGPEKIANMDPKIFHVLIPGPSERKLARNLLVNNSFDLIVVWTKSSLNEVYPWRPTIRDQDRANVHVFKLRS